MERQRILQGRPFEFHIHEQALRLPVGGARVMNEQPLKLTLVADQARITIRVVPCRLGDDREHGSRYQENLAAISEVALGRGESGELLAALASEFDRPEDSCDVPDGLAEEQLQRGR
jgi:hypothetical protein